MRIGVTGASGLIGRALVTALEERGDQVVRFIRTTTPQGTTSVRWDPAHGAVDEGDLQRVGGFDAIVNLAGAGIGDRRWTAARKNEILESRVAAATTLTTALHESGVGTDALVNASAIGWYGSRGDDVLDESSSSGSGFLAEVCRAWEDATQPISDAGTVVTHLRSGIVLSARGGALRQQLALFRVGLGGRYGSGRQWMSPVSLFDEVRAILFALDHPVVGPINVVAPSPVTNREFTKVLANAVRRPAIFAVPHFALDAALGSEMASELVFASQRVVPEVLTNAGFTFEHADAASAVAWALRAP